MRNGERNTMEVIAGTSEELIRRSDAINAINSVGWLEDAEYEERILAIPTIEPKRGEWVNKDSYWHTAICSNCNKVTMFEEWDEKVIEYDFCPNCGCAMTKE